MLAAITVFALPLTGAAVNPARWLGTVLWEQTLPDAANPWGDTFVFLAGPILGALAGGLVIYRVLMPGLLETSSAKVAPAPPACQTTFLAGQEKVTWFLWRWTTCCRWTSMRASAANTSSRIVAISTATEGCRVGPRATIVFENRQTLWFRVHEALRIGRISDPKAVQAELDLFNTLLPSTGRAAGGFADQRGGRIPAIQRTGTLGGPVRQSCAFCLGKDVYAGTITTCRPEDRAIGTAHWIEFTLNSTGRKQLADFRQTALLEITLPAYNHRSALLSDEIRQSLVDDLKH